MGVHFRNHFIADDVMVPPANARMKGRIPANQKTRSRPVKVPSALISPIPMAMPTVLRADTPMESKGDAMIIASGTF